MPPTSMKFIVASLFTLLLALNLGVVPFAHAAAGDSTNSPAPGLGGAANNAGGGNAGASNSGGLQNPLTASSLPDLLTVILHTVVQLGSILLVLALVYVGFLFVVAQGNEEKIRDARSALVWTVLGGIILLGAEAISIVIQATVQAL